MTWRIVFPAVVSAGLLCAQAEEPGESDEIETLPLTVVESVRGEEESPESDGGSYEAEPEFIAVAPLDTVVGLDPIESELARWTRSATVIDLDAIRDGRPLVNLNETLNRVPGVSVQNAENFTQDTRLSIRGFGSRSAFGIRGVRLLLDDFPLTLPDGQSFVDALDLTAADRIEVLRGPSSAQFGNASGGVVRIGLRPIPETPMVEGEWVGGSDGLRRERFVLGGSTERHRGELRFSDLRYDGWREHSATESTIWQGRTIHDPNDTLQVRTFVSHVDSPWSEDAGGLTSDEVRSDRRQAGPNNLRYDAGESVRDHTLGLGVDFAPDDAHRFRATVFHHGREFINRLPFQTGGAVAFDRSFSGASFSWERTDDDTTLLIGTDLAWQEDDRRRFDNNFGQVGALRLDQEETVFQGGVFGQFEWRPSDDWTFRGGLRHDRVEFEVDDAFLIDGDDSGSRRYGEKSWNLGASRRLGDTTHLFANLSRSFETPTTTELADPNGGGFVADLVPQTSLGFEAGLRGETEGGFRYEAVGFHIATENELVPFERAAFPGRRFYRSAGATERTGIELSGGKEFKSDWFVFASLSAGSYRFETFTDPSGGSLAGNGLPGVPGWEAFLEAGYRPASGFYAVADLDGTGGLFAEDANSLHVPSSVVAGLRLGWRREVAGWTVHPWLRIANLTGEEYFDNVRINAAFDRYFEPAPGTTVRGGITATKRF